MFSERFFSVMNSASSKKLPNLNDDELSTIFQENVLPFVNNQAIFQICKFIYLVVIPAKNFYLSVIPLIETEENDNYQFPELAGSLEFLVFLETVTRSILKSIQDSKQINFALLRQLINQILPFGRPIVHDAYFASQLISPGDLRRFNAGYQVVSPSPIPSWKVSLLFSRPQLELKLKEVVMGSIDNKNNYFEVYGELKCVASINYLPDITAKVDGLEKFAGNLSCHYCIKKIDGDNIVFSPPTGVSQLLLYKSIVQSNEPPVDGIYKIFEDEVGLHFSLTINAKPPIKSIMVQLPFQGRGTLTKHQFQNPGGQLKMSKKEATIMWLAKFTEEQKSLELTGILNFEIKESKSIEKYKAYVSFKSAKRTFTGISVDKESVEFSSLVNINIVTEQSYATETKKYIFLAQQEEKNPISQ